MRRATEQISNIDIHKSSGIRDVPSKLLKLSLPSLPEIFTALLNLCITTAKFPEKWKLAQVVCLPKGGALSHPSNIRPISLLPITGKILEYFINDELLRFFESNSLYSNYQFGFRRARSTKDCCLGLVDEINTAFNDNLSLLAVFVDLAKAFNTINHSILLRKLANMGITGSLLSLIENRTQSVFLNGYNSQIGSISDGVPQGSVLGPTLFICYINDIMDCDFVGGGLLYADDTVIYCKGYNVIAFQNEMNRNLSLLNQYCSENRLTIN